MNWFILFVAGLLEIHGGLYTTVANRGDSHFAGGQFPVAWHCHAISTRGNSLCGVGWYRCRWHSDFGDIAVRRFRRFAENTEPLPDLCRYCWPQTDPCLTTD